MIKIPIDQIGKAQGSEFHFHGSQSDLDLQGTGFPVNDTNIGLRLLEAEDGYYLAGRLTGTAVLQCHRCLSEFDYPFDLELGALITFERRKEFEGEGGIIVVSPQSDEIDITKYISDTIVLDIPYKILCKEDCRGLCSSCGTNLNYDTCDCTQDTIDPRWEKLKELNFDQEGE
ncbi:MAG TPA: DUF177 domain-containing protein [bacterium]|nr:DUF177 domain-containing protein [bacterium]